LLLDLKNRLFGLDPNYSISLLNRWNYLTSHKVGASSQKHMKYLIAVLIFCPFVLRAQVETMSRDEVIRKNAITQKLEMILEEDQKYRSSSDWKKILKADSANQIEVIKILDTYGWLGEDEVGKKGNAALFLVIQHADLPIQEKYLPMMRKAVEDGKARPADLALLEDRVRKKKNEKQLYGSQLVKDKSGSA